MKTEQMSRIHLFKVLLALQASGHQVKRLQLYNEIKLFFFVVENKKHWHFPDVNS